MDEQHRHVPGVCSDCQQGTDAWKPSSDEPALRIKPSAQAGVSFKKEERGWMQETEADSLTSTSVRSKLSRKYPSVVRVPT